MTDADKVADLERQLADMRKSRDYHAGEHEKTRGELRDVMEARSKAMKEGARWLEERDAARARVAELEAEHTPRGRDLEALRAAIREVFPGLSFAWSAFPSMLKLLDTMRADAEEKVEALANRVQELHGDFIMSGPDAHPTPAPGLREAVAPLVEEVRIHESVHRLPDHHVMPVRLTAGVARAILEAYEAAKRA